MPVLGENHTLYLQLHFCPELSAIVIPSIPIFLVSRIRFYLFYIKKCTKAFTRFLSREVTWFTCCQSRQRLLEDVCYHRWISLVHLCRWLSSPRWCLAAYQCSRVDLVQHPVPGRVASSEMNLYSQTQIVVVNIHNGSWLYLESKVTSHTVKQSVRRYMTEACLVLNVEFRILITAEIHVVLQQNNQKLQYYEKRNLIMDNWINIFVYLL